MDLKSKVQKMNGQVLREGWIEQPRSSLDSFNDCVLGVKEMGMATDSEAKRAGKSSPLQDFGGLLNEE